MSAHNDSQSHITVMEISQSSSSGMLPTCSTPPRDAPDKMRKVQSTPSMSQTEIVCLPRPAVLLIAKQTHSSDSTLKTTAEPPALDPFAPVDTTGQPLRGRVSSSCTNSESNPFTSFKDTKESVAAITNPFLNPGNTPRLPFSTIDFDAMSDNEDWSDSDDDEGSKCFC